MIQQGKPITGYSSLSISKGKLLSIVHLMQAMGVRYGLGAKAVPLSASPPTFAPPGHVDCSGFARYAFYHVCNLTVPDGSSNQNDYLKSQGFKHHAIPAPGDYTTNLDPTIVYACFCRAGTRGETIGHVWFIVNIRGTWWSVESHGGVGPNSRLAITPVLERICTDLYPLGYSTD
jgi:hypothetical protein